MDIDPQRFKVGLKDSPRTIYYIPDFISEEEEKYLLSKVYAAPKPKWTQLAHRRLQNWGGLPHPKGMVAETLPEWLQRYTEKLSQLNLFEGRAPNHVLVNEYLPGQGIMPHEDGPLFFPVVSTISLGSHTLLDFYHHREDLKLYEGEETSIPDKEQHQLAVKEKTVNQVFQERTIEDGKSANPRAEAKHSSAAPDSFMSVLLERRSLVLVCDDMYTKHLHGIAERTQDIVGDKIVNLKELSQPVSLGHVLPRETRVSLTIRHVPRTVKAKFVFGRR
ncbi:alpha-ketoglutarate-dependent dioxygenase alkb homolog 6 [Plakobranchus ocellatus]|uniref:Alpha-ketoglutarate-dependent dioxygenase alkb homolog 6 n=1 Tax=Plakobranchus ocellatus TaxID=259542 RepID=A0AAV4DCK8_9GAST|nr:alpha-ketoglutarate-dependent dioxygenase alkb homolog 6 [Plakobranchus ocellatus]